MSRTSCGRLAAVSALWLFTAGAAVAAGPVHWGYHGEIGPDHWGALSPAFGLCRDGVEQTPIDLDPAGSLGSSSPVLGFSYGRNALDVFNNGHTVQANVLGSGRSITLNGERYDLLQFHFHTPSEHTVDGAEYPLELHLVHRNSSGGLSVVGVFVKRGAAHAELNKVFANLPALEGEHRAVSSFDLRQLLPDDDDGEFFHYPGSLTTPPCSEGVRWNVFAEPIEMSRAQIGAFVAIFSGHDFPDGNRRPVQPLNGRLPLLVELDD